VRLGLHCVANIAVDFSILYRLGDLSLYAFRYRVSTDLKLGGSSALA